MEKSDSNIGLFFCSHSRPNSSEGSAKDERRKVGELAQPSMWRRISGVCEARVARPPQFKF